MSLTGVEVLIIDTFILRLKLCEKVETGEKYSLETSFRADLVG